MEKQYPVQEDRLRARFTSWLTTLLRRARIDYLRQLERDPNTIAIDAIDEYQMAAEDKYFSMLSDFQFEEERLAQAFFSLSARKSEILKCLFAEQLTVEETAKRLHTTIENVYKEKSRALATLRKKLNGEKGEE